MVSDDLFQMGKKAGDAMAAALGNKGKVGYIFHDADFYVTNQRDGAFKATIEKDYPEMQIVAEAGMADPARAEEIAQAMLTQHPDLDGIYVTWAEPALESCFRLCRSPGNAHTKIVTLDLNEPAALDMVAGAATLPPSSPTRPMLSAAPRRGPRQAACSAKASRRSSSSTRLP